MIKPNAIINGGNFRNKVVVRLDGRKKYLVTSVRNNEGEVTAGTVLAPFKSLTGYARPGGICSFCVHVRVGLVAGEYQITDPVAAFCSQILEDLMVIVLKCAAIPS